MAQLSNMIMYSARELIIQFSSPHHFFFPKDIWVYFKCGCYFSYLLLCNKLL